MKNISRSAECFAHQVRAQYGLVEYSVIDEGRYYQHRLRQYAERSCDYVFGYVRSGCICLDSYYLHAVAPLRLQCSGSWDWLRLDFLLCFVRRDGV